MQCLVWGLTIVSTRGIAHRRSATMPNVTLFCGTLEPTRMRWKDYQVRTTSLETREAIAEECNGVKSVCGSTDRQRQRQRQRRRRRRRRRQRQRQRLLTDNSAHVSEPPGNVRSAAEIGNRCGEQGRLLCQ